ncbi:GNAT family N-acetyltransferase [Pontibacillus sp. ALD_SL1]|uniref:GNAT family N-acetyltransferase n=1 Tax=Pontibacillus sp. ALD_SL1 TaxID=2777185 RepID=UPI001A970F8E|nr:GNAT family N-acetyltransferase [Pontibacillus sp. ALD_SL1]QST01727.1 GNAT family N-acetyltransferase [Pontibacillus sp. ALD_SL1]
MEVKKVETEEDIKAIYSLMYQLRSHLNQEDYVELVIEAMAFDRYQLIALMEQEKPVAAIGYKRMTTLYYGRFIWVCDLVTDQKERSKGFGNQLLTYVEKEAATLGFHTVALSSGIKRHLAHRFYEHHKGYEKARYVLKKKP